MKNYQILSRYTTDKEFGQWQVGIFHDIEQANQYIAETLGRYHEKYPEFEMKAVEVDTKTAEEFNDLLLNMCD